MIFIEEPIPDDAGEIFFIQRQTWHESYIDYLSHEDIEKRFCDSPKRIQKIREKINDKNHTKYFIARDEEKIIGFISLSNTPRNEIHSLYVIQGYQGQGIGKKLLLKGIDWFYDKPVFVHVNKKNELARKFYEKFQFQFTKNVSQDESKGFELIELCKN